METQTVGIQISNLRKQHGLTQAELAEKCRLNIRTVQRIESGEVVPRSYTLRILSEALGSRLTNASDKSNDADRMKMYRKSFERRKQIRMITFFIAIFMMIAVFILAFPSWVLFGMPKQVWAPFFYLILFADLIGILLTWRCPGCNGLLGEVFSQRYCSKCGLRFYDE